MAWLKRIFGDRKDREALAPLYRAVVSRGRDPAWYREGGVADTQDGRFDMIACVLSLVLIRIEAEGEGRAAESSYLTELFIEDMDAQLREIGFGDVVVGKHVGRMMGALGGRLGAYRRGLAEGDLETALVRNLYRGKAPDADALGFVAGRLRALHAALFEQPVDRLFGGDLPEVA